MEGISLDFHCFKALNNNLEARLFYMLIFMPHQIFWWRVGPCSSDFLNCMGTVLTCAFKHIITMIVDAGGCSFFSVPGWFLKTLLNIMEARLIKVDLWCLCCTCIILFRWINKQPKIQKTQQWMGEMSIVNPVACLSLLLWRAITIISIPYVFLILIYIVPCQ